MGSEMKLIEAYIPAETLYEVQDVLAQQGIEDAVASEVAIEISRDRQYRESYLTGFVPQVKLELAVADNEAIAIARRIFKAAARVRANRRIQVLIGPLEQVVRIETGKRIFPAM